MDWIGGVNRLSTSSHIGESYLTATSCKELREIKSKRSNIMMVMMMEMIERERERDRERVFRFWVGIIWRFSRGEIRS